MAELKELRRGIDAVDEQMIRLFVERMRLSDAVAQYKRENALPIQNVQREREILDWAQREGGEYGSYARELFAALIELSKARQQEHGTQCHKS